MVFSAFYVADIAIHDDILCIGIYMYPQDHYYTIITLQVAQDTWPRMR